MDRVFQQERSKCQGTGTAATRATQTTLRDPPEKHRPLILPRQSTKLSWALLVAPACFKRTKLGPSLLQRKHARSRQVSAPHRRTARYGRRCVPSARMRARLGGRSTAPTSPTHCPQHPFLPQHRRRRLPRAPRHRWRTCLLQGRQRSSQPDRLSPCSLPGAGPGQADPALHLPLYPPRGCVQITVPALKAFLAANRSGPLEIATGHFAGLRPAPEQHQTIHPHPDTPRARYPDRYIEQAPSRRQKGGPARPLSLDPLTLTRHLPARVLRGEDLRLRPPAPRAARRACSG
jgi:hypothetical protein